MNKILEGLQNFSEEQIEEVIDNKADQVTKVVALIDTGLLTGDQKSDIVDALAESTKVAPDIIEDLIETKVSVEEFSFAEENNFSYEESLSIYIDEVQKNYSQIFGEAYDRYGAQGFFNFSEEDLESEDDVLDAEKAIIDASTIIKVLDEEGVENVGIDEASEVIGDATGANKEVVKSMIECAMNFSQKSRIISDIYYERLFSDTIEDIAEVAAEREDGIINEAEEVLNDMQSQYVTDVNQNSDHYIDPNVTSYMEDKTQVMYQTDATNKVPQKIADSIKETEEVAGNIITNTGDSLTTYIPQPTNFSSGTSPDDSFLDSLNQFSEYISHSGV